MQVNLKGNQLGEEGWCAVFDTLRDNPQNKIAMWDLSGQDINTIIAKSLAAYMTVAASLTSLNLSDNKLCGVKYGKGTYDATGITALAEALRGNASLTEVIAPAPPAPCLCGD